MANWWDNDPVVDDPVVTGSTGALTPDALRAAGQKRVGGEELSWADVPGQAAANLIPSAGQFASDIVQPILHPVETATNIYNVGRGALEKTGAISGDEHVKYADAVGEYFSNRYGGMEQFKKALANDPVGVAGDLSALFSGGGSAAARAPGIVGRVGEVARTAGRLTDPLTPVAATARGVGRAATEIAALPSGVGGRSLEIARQAGREGGQAAEAFRENMRGNAPIEEVVADARGAVQQLRQERGAEYTQRLQQLGQDRTILSWNDVDTALNDMDRVATFRGQSLSPSTANVRNEIRTVVDDWKNLRASEFWTPEGFDALKKRVGDIRDGTQPHTPERVVADQAYNGIKKTIQDQVPEYARMMHGYERASNIIREIESTLSVKPTANIDTSLRKLQSVLRNNVSTNFGRREALAEFLANSGAPQLMQKLAGQTLNTWAPRGLMRGVAGALPIVGGAALTPGVAAALPLMSPRLMGEAAVGLGTAQRYASPLTELGSRYREPGRQVGRLAGELPPDDPKRVYVYPK